MDPYKLLPLLRLGAHVLVQQLPGQAITDGRKIPYPVYDKTLQPILNQVGRVENLLSDYDPDKPQSALTVLNKAAKQFVSSAPPSPPSPVAKFIKDHDLNKLPMLAEFLVDCFEQSKPDAKRICETEEDVLLEYTVDGHKLYKTVDPETFDTKELMCNDHVRDKLLKSLAELAWKAVADGKHDAISVDRGRDDVGMTPITFSDKPYHGEVKAYIEEVMRLYGERGIRRVIILQGEPGTGKSTLTQNIAKQSGGRTIVLSNGFIQNVNNDDWRMLMDVMSPRVVIIDDIDRVDQKKLTQSLTMFETANYNVPMTLMTTNNVNSMPDAWRRPGRIDVIIDMPEPSEDIQREMLTEFLKDYGINIEDVPQESVDVVKGVIKDYPGAYAEEFLRRMVVHGWDYQPPKYDKVFCDILNTAHKSAEKERKRT